MNQEQKHFLLIHQGLIPVSLNVIINVAIAWLLFRNLDSVPLWGEQSVMVDAIFTVFLLTVINALVTTLAARKAALKNAALAAPRPLPHALPASNWLRSILLGCTFSMTLIPLFMLIFSVLNVSQLSLNTFLIFKGAYVLAIVTPLIPATAWWALCDIGSDRATRQLEN